jgi:hypothetical protein
MMHVDFMLVCVTRLISHFAREGHHAKKQHKKALDGYACMFLLPGMMQRTVTSGTRRCGGAS